MRPLCCSECHTVIASIENMFGIGYVVCPKCRFKQLMEEEE